MQMTAQLAAVDFPTGTVFSSLIRLTTEDNLFANLLLQSSIRFFIGLAFDVNAFVS